MPRPPLPGDVWVHARIKLTTEEFDSFKALTTREQKTDAALITALVRTAIAKISPDALRAYRALRGPVHKPKSSPPPPKAKSTK